MRTACKLLVMRAKIKTGFITLNGATEQYSMLETAFLTSPIKHGCRLQFAKLTSQELLTAGLWVRLLKSIE